MNLRQALYIQTIAHEGGITAAAKKLYISQPSLSQMLLSIEAEIGVPLFIRNSNPFRPTYAGERYLHAAEIILNAQRALDNELKEIRGEEFGRLKIGISMQREAEILPAVLPKFYKRYPNVKVDLMEAGSAKQEEFVQNGSIDFAFASTIAGNPNFQYIMIKQETIGLLCGPDSLQKEIRRLQDAADSLIVSLKIGHNLRIIQDQLFERLLKRPEIILETDSLETARRLVAVSPYCMICSDAYVEPNGLHKKCTFIPIWEYENVRHFYAFYLSSSTLPKYALFFIELVKQLYVPKPPAG